MELLNKVMKYLTVFQPKNLSELQVCAGDHSTAQCDSALEERSVGAKVAAIAAALHHHSLENDDVRAKVAAIAAALHHHEMETAAQNNGSLGLAALVAAIHHHNTKTK
ncbi:MAG TPA: hypothetical protein VFX57_02755 [Sulfuricurvum sp.]|nr:hypothetical protein [Sulfuricurvum sp.]